jgi:hypothetical protein
MVIEANLPWYAALLGSAPEGEGFDRLLAEFKLTTEEAEKAVRWYENENLGVSVLIRQGKIDAIQLYSAEHPDFDGFQGELPLGLDFEMTRHKVQERLGNADHVTTPRSIGPNLRHSGIDRYYATTCNVAVTYSASSGRIEVLSFESKVSG